MRLFIASVAATLPLLVVGSTAHGRDIAAGRWGGVKPDSRMFVVKPNPRGWGPVKPNPRLYGVKPNPKGFGVKPNPRGFGPVKPNPRYFSVKPNPIRWGHAKPRGIRYVRTDSVRSRVIGRLATAERR